MGIILKYRGVAKFGIALGSGPRGHGFESRHSDQKNRRCVSSAGFQLSLPCRQVKLLRSEVCCTSVLANLTSHRASARYFTAATPLLHLAKPNFTEPYHM